MSFPLLPSYGLFMILSTVSFCLFSVSRTPSLPWKRNVGSFLASKSFEEWPYLRTFIVWPPLLFYQIFFFFVDVLLTMVWRNTTFHHQCVTYTSVLNRDEHRHTFVDRCRGPVTRSLVSSDTRTSRRDEKLRVKGFPFLSKWFPFVQ